MDNFKTVLRVSKYTYLIPTSIYFHEFAICTTFWSIKSETITVLFKVQSSCLFNLLLSLETPSPDPLHIAELIKEEKPLKPIDFCYRDEDEMVNVLDCISLCVMVVSYSAESMRGYQMLVSFSTSLRHKTNMPEFHWTT